MPESKTIAYLSSLYPYATDTFVRREVKRLRQLGFDVHPFSVRKPGQDVTVSPDIAEEQARTGFLVESGAIALTTATVVCALKHPIRMLRAMRLACRTSAPGIKCHFKQLAYLMEASLLAKWMKDKGCRHLHNHLGENSAAVAMLASILSGIPYSLTVHGPNEFDRPEQIALGEKIRRAKFVVAISDFGRSQLFRWCGHDQWPKIHIVHCGVDAQFLKHHTNGTVPANRFVCLGRLSEPKGQLLLIDAAARLAKEGLDFQLVLVGDGPMRREIESLIERHGLQDRVAITGWVSSDRVRDEIVKSRALVMPSFAEGLPVAIMEALALKRPVIGTYIAAIPELVQPGVCGWLVPPGSVDALVDAMREALVAPQEALDRMGEAGAARVAERHDVTIEVSKLAKLLDQSLGINTTSAPATPGGK